MFWFAFTFVRASIQLRLARISASKLWCFSILACKLMGSLQLSSWATDFFSFNHEHSLMIEEELGYMHINKNKKDFKGFQAEIY